MTTNILYHFSIFTSVEELQHQCGRVGKETVPSPSGESALLHPARIKPPGAAWVPRSRGCSPRRWQCEEEFSGGGRAFGGR